MEIPITPPKLAMSELDLDDLRYARSLLENPGLAARLANFLGSPIERGFQMLPKDWSVTIHNRVRSALMTALEVAMSTMDKQRRQRASEFMHKVLVGASGGIGGVFGFPALAVELPLSTTIMLRSIADIARSEGHNLSVVQTKLSCLEVFALGGRTKEDDAAESAYWAARAALSSALSEAAAYITQKGVAERSAPAVLRFITAISSRFGVVVSEEVAAKAVPIVGAAGGAMINVLFIDHFQDMARGHFIVKRLELEYGIAAVQDAYGRVADSR